MADNKKIQIPRLKLGNQGLEVSKLGFGCMGLTGGYNTPLAEEYGIAIFIDAFNKGITFFDTADVYGSHANEVLVGKALKLLPRDKVQLATKFGIVRMGPDDVIVKGSPEYVRSVGISDQAEYDHRDDQEVKMDKPECSLAVMMPQQHMVKWPS